MVWIVRLLVLPLVLVTAAFLLVAGFVVGMAGVFVRLAVGHCGLLSTGAELMRTVERLPFLAGARDRTYVYFIQDGRGATKVGISHDPPHRMTSLQTGHPEQLVLTRAIRQRTESEARAVERALHVRFAAHRLNGEWFDLSPQRVRLAIRLARRRRWSSTNQE